MTASHRFADYFVVCGLDEKSDLEPEDTNTGRSVCYMVWHICYYELLMYSTSLLHSIKFLWSL